MFHAATSPMRAKDICRALGTGTTVMDTEGLRARLKRLVARQILTKPEPGLFTASANPVASRWAVQAITAAGTGCAAALDAERFIATLS
ncbi:hypothetical protein AB0N23_35965 [Streptomyces sp. NPDC052644]